MREFIESELDKRFVLNSESQTGGTQPSEQQARLARALKTKEILLSRITARLSAYELSPQRSLAAAVLDAIDEELTQELGIVPPARSKRTT